MTTLVMVQTPDDVILGWDTLGTNGNEQNVLTTPKMIVKQGVVYGVTGTLRALDLLQVAELPEYDGSDAREWIIRTLVPALQGVYRGQVGMIDEDGRPEFAILAVVDGQAFEIDGLFSPVQTTNGIYTHGSGGDYARGALFLLMRRGGLVNEDAVMDALGVAASIDPYTGGALVVCKASKYLTTEAV